MKNLSPLLLVLFFFCSCARTDQKIISKIEKECSINFTHATNGVGAEVYNVYMIDGIKINQVGIKAKNIIDKTLNVLPDKKSEMEFNWERNLENYYHWETPTISVELSVVFAGDHSKMKVYIVNK